MGFRGLGFRLSGVAGTEFRSGLRPRAEERVMLVDQNSTKCLRTPPKTCKIFFLSKGSIGMIVCWFFRGFLSK